MTDKNYTLATLGSHSALEICRGAKDEGFATLVLAQKGREKTYASYYQTRGEKGCVDECLVLPEFSDVLSREVQKTLRQKNCIFVPHRSFEAYVNFDYEAIEQEFRVPMFGNRYLLRIEERGKGHPDQYDVLKAANIRYPQPFSSPSEINRLSIVKVSEKARLWERAFFLAKDAPSFTYQSQEMIATGKITSQALKEAVIEEYVVGTPVNFNFFYSPLSKRLELLGTDTRRQTNIEGVTRLPGRYQEVVIENSALIFEEAGHIAVTVVESLLEEVFAIGERFVSATQRLIPPGIIGPFALQAIIVPEARRKEIVVVDVSPRMPGSPGIAATPYSGYFFGEPVSMGRRIAMEIKEALLLRCLEKIVT